jgi:hypothetical protein
MSLAKKRILHDYDAQRRRHFDKHFKAISPSLCSGSTA